MMKAHRICIMAVLILLILPFALAQTAHHLSAETKEVREARIVWWCEDAGLMYTRS